MNIDSTKFKNALVTIVKKVRQMEEDLLAQQIFLDSLRQLGIGDDIDSRLAMVKGSSAVQQALVQKYDEPLEKVLSTIDDIELDQQLTEFLEKWNPKDGPAN